MAKKYKGFGQVETPANTRADLLIQERNLRENKKLENKLIDTGYNSLSKGDDSSTGVP